MDFSSTDTTKPTSPAQVSYSDTAFGTAVAGKQIERRRNLSMIAMDLKAIWEISAKTIRERGSGIGESEMSNIAVTTEDFVSLIEMRRPPHNFFDVAMLRDIADALDALEADTACRTVVLAAKGKSFCAGADLTSVDRSVLSGARPAAVYEQGIRLFRFAKPMVAAVHGAAIGGGLGLALAADFRIACPEARLSANFTALGFHPGFGLSVSLPRVIGRQAAAMMLLTSRRIGGEEAARIGLVDQLVARDEVRPSAMALAAEIAGNAPLAVRSTRATQRHGLADEVEAMLKHELDEQIRLRDTADYNEGVAAMSERRTPDFTET